jgi:hypothetical protein
MASAPVISLSSDASGPVPRRFWMRTNNAVAATDNMKMGIIARRQSTGRSGRAQVEGSGGHLGSPPARGPWTRRAGGSGRRVWKPFQPRKSPIFGRPRSPYCTQASVDHVHAMYFVANVSLGVGLAALGTATWLFATHSTDMRPPARSDYAIDVKPTRSGAFASMSGSF